MNATVIVGWYLIAAVIVFGMVVAGWCVGFTSGRRQGQREGIRAAKVLHKRLEDRLRSTYAPHDPPASHGHPHGRV